MVSRDQVAELMEKVFEECRRTRAEGQKEYAHDDANALANFEDEGRDLGIPREKVWAIFAGKHWRGIRAWINGHRSQRENVRGRIKDLIVYLVLLWAMADDDEEGEIKLPDQGKVSEGRITGSPPGPAGFFAGGTAHKPFGQSLGGSHK